MSVPTVLVLPFPGQGHVNPIMSLSQKLIEHGCRVIFVNTDFNHKRVILPIGLLLNTATARSLGQFQEEDLSCMSWLDQQPHCSVTYVAFGSVTLFYQNQFNELALGLDLANGPFLWVVHQDNKMAYPYEFQRTKCHCGWNSTIEGLSSGVPFLCWPYFADQIYNKTYICDEWKVGLGLNSDESGLVSRWEIQNKLDKLLGDEN
ncbi:hypothetical protein JHK82_047445 [Glycine max]|nr:hypothetical protein JHK82_047445 [Glycine max]